MEEESESRKQRNLALRQKRDKIVPGVSGKAPVSPNNISDYMTSQVERQETRQNHHTQGRESDQTNNPTPSPNNRDATAMLFTKRQRPSSHPRPDLQETHCEPPKKKATTETTRKDISPGNTTLSTNNIGGCITAQAERQETRLNHHTQGRESDHTNIPTPTPNNRDGSTLLSTKRPCPSSDPRPDLQERHCEPVRKKQMTETTRKDISRGESLNVGECSKATSRKRGRPPSKTGTGDRNTGSDPPQNPKTPRAKRSSADTNVTTNKDFVAGLLNKFKYRSLAPPKYICKWCNARMWFEERVVKTSKREDFNFNLCCREGTVRLPELMDPPQFLRNLLNPKNGQEARIFREKIRTYNYCYAFTSMGAKIDHSVTNTLGPYTFRISGQNIHYIGSLLPVGEREPSFIQLYVYDTADELEMRERAVGRNGGNLKLDKAILSGLKEMLDDVNPLAHMFRTAQQRIKENEGINLSVRLIGSRQRTHNSPTAPEIAALIIGDFEKSGVGRDIIVQLREGGLQRITELHPSFMALQYPILFPFGEDSFYLEIPYYMDSNLQRKTMGKREHVTMREYYAYRLQQRESNGYALLHGGKLLHQYIVDCCTAIESSRLLFIRQSQPKLRCELLNNLCDAVEKGDCWAAEVGKRIILPASFTGGPRYMQQNYQDAMAICRWFGNPHLFITFTANPKWPEIEAMLWYTDGQKIEDRPEIISRVFRLKLRQLMDCFKKEHYFGTDVADVYTIEFQKRGLPHAHILLWLKSDEVELSPNYIDSIIRAEIPDKDKEPELYEVVSRCMVHGPCGDANRKCPCMINNKCSKKYPRSFNEETTIDSNGYPVYRRKDDGR